MNHEEIETLRAKSAGWVALVLEHDLFSGDFGDGIERTLYDEIRIVKRGGICAVCQGAVTKGTAARYLKKADSDGFYGGRYCEACCDAMALDSQLNRGEFEDLPDDEYDAVYAKIARLDGDPQGAVNA